MFPLAVFGRPSSPPVPRRVPRIRRATARGRVSQRSLCHRTAGPSAGRQPGSQRLRSRHGTSVDHHAASTQSPTCSPSCPHRVAGVRRRPCHLHHPAPPANPPSAFGGFRRGPTTFIMRSLDRNGLMISAPGVGSTGSRIEAPGGERGAGRGGWGATLRRLVAVGVRGRGAGARGVARWSFAPYGPEADAVARPFPYGAQAPPVRESAAPAVLRGVGAASRSGNQIIPGRDPRQQIGVRPDEVPLQCPGPSSPSARRCGLAVVRQAVRRLVHPRRGRGVAG